MKRIVNKILRKYGFHIIPYNDLLELKNKVHLIGGHTFAAYGSYYMNHDKKAKEYSDLSREAISDLSNDFENIVNTNKIVKTEDELLEPPMFFKIIRKLFCPHNYILVNEYDIKSEYDMIQESGRVPNSHSSLKRKHIWEYKCEDCNKVKRYTETTSN